jgi:hypothetical protein
MYVIMAKPKKQLPFSLKATEQITLEYQNIRFERHLLLPQVNFLHLVPQLYQHYRNLNSYKEKECIWELLIQETQYILYSVHN